ncbi:hypothetical protein X801_02872 [Opisthorchis viverrini]|uniref:RRM domain-containing protein n=1 Tax=Opisthorchis viverrini TaxID=6198 RepID=A0A1S8X3D3_OPIVI|nr:hypothetical protein X801_02872 [Opisthorchis viverrini]
MSSVVNTDPRRPKKLKRFVPLSSDATPLDQTIDYLNFFGMILSMCGLLFEVIHKRADDMLYAQPTTNAVTLEELPTVQLAPGSYNPVNKRVVYVGGLADQVDLPLLRAAFIPFGDIVSINMPMDYQTGKCQILHGARAHWITRKTSRVRFY